VAWPTVISESSEMKLALILLPISSSSNDTSSSIFFRSAPLSSPIIADLSLPGSSRRMSAAASGSIFSRMKTALAVSMSFRKAAASWGSTYLKIPASLSGSMERISRILPSRSICSMDLAISLL